MSQNEYPIKVAAISVAGTIGACTLIASQWILPTVTASFKYENNILQEKLSKANEISSHLKAANEELSRGLENEKQSHQQELAALKTEKKKLGELLFLAQKANSFLSGSPYPVGLDKVKIGDSKDAIYKVYSSDEISENKRAINIKPKGSIFRVVRYIHSATKSREGKIDSIQYELRTIDRIFDKSLPEVPDGWLEDSLRRALGRPFTVGVDNDCLLWRVSDNEVAYYKAKLDWFEVSGFITYPAGCSITDEQLLKIKSR